jgi:hypothetical protein
MCPGGKELLSRKIETNSCVSKYETYNTVLSRTKFMKLVKKLSVYELILYSD